MPETRFPIRTSRVRRSSAPLLLLIGAALGGCSGGDFGRTRQDFRNDDMHRWLGAEATGSVGLRPRNSSSPTTSASCAISPIP